VRPDHPEDDMIIWPNKDPDDVLDYEFDWTSKLYGDTIHSSTWIVPAPLTKNSDSHTDGKVTIWLSGGTEGATYKLKNLVTTRGRTMVQTFKLPLKSH
jgi:hypothetical protein